MVDPILVQARKVGGGLWRGREADPGAFAQSGLGAAGSGGASVSSGGSTSSNGVSTSSSGASTPPVRVVGAPVGGVAA